MLSGARFFASQALVLFALAVTAHVAGRGVLRIALGRSDRELRGRFAWAMTAGLIVLATAGALLGAVGGLTVPALAVVVVAIHAAGLDIWRGFATRLTGAKWNLRAAVAAALALPCLLLATYPPTAFDETLYHLPFARAFLATGRLPFLPELRFPVFPQVSEVLEAEVLGFGGDTATHLVALLAVGVTAALVWNWGRAWGGQDRPEAGWLAAAIWLGNPLVIYLSGTDYVEPLLALFVTAAGFAFWTWRRGGERRWLALAGGFAGAAAGTKYLGLFFVLALALAALRARPAAPAIPARRSIVDFALFAAAALVVMAPWYARILWLSGNPVFPYLSAIFGANEWTPVHFRGLVGSSDASAWMAALARGATRLATLPWDVVARRGAVGGLPPVSPVYLLGAPLLILAAVRDRVLRAWLFLVCAFVVLFPALPADARYLLPVLPLVGLALGVALADAAYRVPSTRRRAALAGLALLLALPGWLYAGYRIGRLGPPPVDAARREAFLARTLAGYPAVSRVNELARPGDAVYGLHLESMRYFARGTFLGDFYGPHRYSLLEARLPDPQSFRELLAAWRVDYLMVARSTPAAGAAERAAAGFEKVFEDSAVVVYALDRERGGP